MIALEHRNPFPLLELTISPHSGSEGKLCKEALEYLHKHASIVNHLPMSKSFIHSSRVQFVHHIDFTPRVEFACSQIRAVLNVFQNVSIAESMCSFCLKLASQHIHFLSFPQLLNLTVLSLTLRGFGHLYHKKIDQDFSNADYITGLVVSFPALEQLSIDMNNTWCIRVCNVLSLTSLELDLSDVGGLINDEPGLSAMTLYDVL